MSIIKLRNVRLSFPDLFTAVQFKGKGEFKYHATFLIPKEDPQVKVIQETIQNSAKERWGAKAEVFTKEAIANNRYCFRDGDAKDLEGYAGCMALHTSNKIQPKLLNRDKSPIIEDKGELYSGCYVVCSVDVYAYDNDFGKFVSATLRGVQFMTNGDAFTGGGPVKDDEFDDLADTGEADGLT